MEVYLMLSMQKGLSVKSHGDVVAKGMGNLVLAIRRQTMLITDQCYQGLN